MFLCKAAAEQNDLRLFKFCILFWGLPFVECSLLAVGESNQSSVAQDRTSVETHTPQWCNPGKMLSLGAQADRLCGVERATAAATWRTGQSRKRVAGEVAAIWWVVDNG